MSRRVVQIPVTWDSANRKKDRSVSIKFTSNLEIPNDEFALMDTFHGEAGFLVFSENEIQPSDIPQEDAATDEKSDTVRLYNVMYADFKQNNELPDSEFKNWRHRQMERHINYHKQRLSND